LLEDIFSVSAGKLPDIMDSSTVAPDHSGFERLALHHFGYPVISRILSKRGLNLGYICRYTSR
jgi:hypothetical protein